MSDETLILLTAQITANFVANSSVATSQVGDVIRSVHAALAGLDPARPEAEPEHPPATTVRRSLANPDRIISMIDGKPYSSLKRHLGNHGLTPDEYRERYKLPAGYPIVAPGYSERRRELAKAIGLGRKAGARLVQAAEAVVGAVLGGGPADALVDAAPAASPPPPARKRLGIAAAKAAARDHLGEEK